MNIVIFTGPSLSAEEARRELPATFLPPAAQGDVYRAALNSPQLIGIIDGVFDHVPSVWHKEILWAMSQGIHVFGSASMGALRAAELADFGMTGVGEIFRAFQAGTLEDDDEVAVAHGTQAEGFRVLSDAMVNIRQTLGRAVQEGVLGAPSGSTMERIAKELPYPERSYARVLELAGNAGVRVSELNALRAWLPTGKIDQKREDAIRMLRAIRAAVEEGLPPKQVNYKFENTVVWDALANSAGLLSSDGGGAHNLQIDEILGELWQNPELCLQAYQYATIRHLVRQAARLSGASLSQAKIAAVEAGFRADRGITEEAAFKEWLQQYQLTPAQFADLIAHEALLHESSLAPWPFPHRWLVDWLRISDQFHPLVASALANKASVNGATLEAASPSDPATATEALLQWYVERLASPNERENAASRTMLTYLRKDWDVFLASLVKQHRAAGSS